MIEEEAKMEADREEEAFKKFEAQDIGLTAQVLESEMPRVLIKTRESLEWWNVDGLYAIDIVRFL